MDVRNLVRIGSLDLINLPTKNDTKVENSYSHDGTVTFSQLPKDLTMSIDSHKRSRESNKTNTSKMSMNFLAVSREKNQKRQYFDWNNKPMLLINSNEVEPKKFTESHNVLPKSRIEGLGTLLSILTLTLCL